MSAGIKVETVNYVPDELLRGYFQPVRVIYNDPVTICYFADGTKRTSTCRETDQYNKEFGVSVCVIKKIFRRYSNFLRLLDSGYEQENKVAILGTLGNNMTISGSTLTAEQINNSTNISGVLTNEMLTKFKKESKTGNDCK